MKRFKQVQAAMVLGLAMGLGGVAYAAPADTPAAAEQGLRDQLRVDRKTAVLKAMALDEAAAAKFLPIYTKYEAELLALNRKFNRMVVEYVGHDGIRNDAQAKVFVKEVTAYEDAEIKLYRKYHPKVVKAVGQSAAARFLTVEKRIRALQDGDLWK